MAERWEISVEEGFRLTDGEGRAVRVGQRKCEELLYAMASRQEEWISRDSLAEEIWPLDSWSARRDNFRQALTKLRRAVGAERILADRQSVGFASGFRVGICSSNKLEASTEPDDKKVSAAEGFLSLLEWQAADEPALLFETLRVNSALVHALPPKKIRRLVRLAAPHLQSGDLNRHWVSCWIGMTHFSASGLTKSEPYLKAALNSGLAISDGRLVLRSGSALAVGLILAGKPNEATRLLDRISTPSYLSPGDKRGLEVIRAAAYQHLGRHEDSDWLLQSHANSASSLESADIRALAAFFQSTIGRFRSAADALREPLKYARRVGALGVIHGCELALGYIDAYEAPLSAVERLDRIAKECDEGGFSHLALYAKEGSAVACVHARQFSEARVRLEEAVVARRTLSFGLTQWDRRRLAPLAGAVGSARLL